MYDDESKTGIKIYTVIFLVLLVSFIGFIIFKEVDDKGIDNSKVRKKSQLRATN
ncbi:MAG: hypothetical protein NTY74_03815 [Ignavibacteriae bacterium]|nr:hypothetical protein [Ignavibacteriota bacterium]